MSLHIQTRVYWQTHEGHEIWLMEVDHEHLEKMKHDHPDVIGVPQYFHRHHDGHIEVWPKPEK